MELRPYQNNAVTAVANAFNEVRSALIVLPTGAGKTIVFSKIADNEVHNGGRVLILAHRGELLDQARDKLFKSTGIVAGLEKAEFTSDGDFDQPPFMVVVGSVQSMCKEKRLERFSPNDFTLIVIDECHHALSNTYQTIFSHFTGARLLGVTATPDRGDLRSLGEVFEKIAFEYTIVEAIRDGYLSPIRAQTIPLKIDITGVATQNGDYQASGLDCALEPYLRQICREIRVRAMDRKTVIFTPLIATSQKMLAIFNEEGMVDNVREVNGQSVDRADVLNWFANADKGCVLLNSMLLTEGWDEPSCDCICVLRATKSRSLYVQMVGRGTRLCKDKRNLLLLDFLWMSSTHDLCRPACIISQDADVCETITKRQEDEASKQDLELTPEVLEDCESETVRKREEALAKKLREMRRKQGKLVDPLQYAYSIEDVNLTNYRPLTNRDASQPTMDQLKRLERLGFGCPDSFGAAEMLIHTGEKRQAQGLATPKEIRLLERHGFRHVAKWTHEHAHKWVGRLIVNGFRIPSNVNPETGLKK